MEEVHVHTIGPRGDDDDVERLGGRRRRSLDRTNVLNIANSKSSSTTRSISPCRGKGSGGASRKKKLWSSPSSTTQSPRVASTGESNHNMDASVAYADYRGPRHHSPKNN
ncbi:hypothetical protein Dimus_014787 [Dionaea muscipula]